MRFCSLSVDPVIKKVISPDFLSYLSFLKSGFRIHIIWNVVNGFDLDNLRRPKQQILPAVFTYQVFCGKYFEIVSHPKHTMPEIDIRGHQEPGIIWCNLCIGQAPPRILEWSEAFVLGNPNPWDPII